ncbi:selenoprotein W-related protein [Pseudarcicella hirudinis]|uniref:Selenoprotein W-related protein n=1 Tax=Pseudarcicella hirudinis TaxID=1079859 RepID=A0A1I5YJC4_9BACT|nr:SelT/SelW/SelH family protein [Pseudarcicella hirudinis]SFQ44288.1 selenoprotein W-related protein [Pseudarcicella hirudinis]
MIQKPKITIEYCPKCGWLLRSAWMAQELLNTFTEELKEVALRPSEVSGRYQIFLEETLIFDRKREGHFPEAKELKQIVRDLIAPGRNLGHIDKHSSNQDQS